MICLVLNFNSGYKLSKLCKCVAILYFVGKIPGVGETHKRSGKTPYLPLCVVLEMLQSPKVYSITNGYVHSQSARQILKKSKLYTSTYYLSPHKMKRK